MPDRPSLPRTAPEGLKRFVECEVERVELDLGDMGWIPKPDGVPDVLTPSARVLDGATTTSATIRVGYGDFISIDLPASIVDGHLRVETSNLGLGIGPEVQKWVDAFNRQLRENGKQLDSFEARGDTVTMSKRTIPAGAAAGGTAIAPVTTTVPGGTTPPAEEPEPAEKSKAGCFAWLAGALAAIAAAVGLTIAFTGDDAGDDEIIGDTGAAATSSTTTTSEPAGTTTTTLTEVGQAPPPSDPPTDQAVCGAPTGVPDDFWSAAPIGQQDLAALAERTQAWADALDDGMPCAPPSDGYGSCDPTLLPCAPDAIELFLLAFGSPGIDHSGSVPDAVTGEEGASTAEQLVAMYAVTGDPMYLVRLTSDCGGNLLTGEAPLVANGLTIVENPLLSFGPCTIVDAGVVPQDPANDDTQTAALERALRASAIGQAYDVGAAEPDPALPTGVDELTVTDERFEVHVDWAEPAVTLGNTLAGAPLTNDCLWFFPPDDTELIVKVLDACGDRQHFWVFYGATTNVEFEMTVTDTAIGTAAHFANPLGATAPAITDTAAFATSDPFFDNTIFPCGHGHVAYTACPDGEPPMEAGAFVAVTAAMFGPVPLEGDGTERVHTVDFGAAGGPAYEIAQSADGWSVTSSAGDTRARALFRDNAIVLVAPQDELPEGALAYVWRTTVDGQTHDQRLLPVDGVIPTPAIPADDPPPTDTPTTDTPTTDAPTTDEPTETLAAFYDRLGPSIAAGDLGFALDRLHPTVFEAYPTECPAALERFADPDLTIEFVSEGPTEPWTFELPDGRTFEIPDATAVTIVLSGRGQSGEPTESHVVAIDGRYHWFTACA